MRTTDQGLKLIMDFEGCSLKPYYCPAGVLTIGYGHVIKPKDAQKYLTGITPGEAEALLRLDAMKAEDAVQRLITARLNPNQFDALVSFVFNLGAGRLASSTLRRMINRGEFDRAADQFPRWVFAGGKKLAGLEKRRKAERALFLAPYDPMPKIDPPTHQAQSESLVAAFLSLFKR